MYAFLTFECTDGSNTFYVPVPFKCKVSAARYCVDANQGGTKTCVISKTGGNTIVSGDFSGTAGTLTNGTVTSTAADKNQTIDVTETISVAIDLTSGTAGTASVWLTLDEFSHTH